MEEVYDPLDYNNLAKSVVTALLEKVPGPLPPKESFVGAGVYAIYYTGNFAPYSFISTSSHEIPIYVGKAIPTGGRKGQIAITPSSGKELFKRLCEHAKSLEQAENLRLEDFSSRYLVVLPVWISLAEKFLIDHYQSVWNVLIDGFGNHPPGKGRKDMRRPKWDIVHPGRAWAKELNAEENQTTLMQRIEEFLNREK